MPIASGLPCRLPQSPGLEQHVLLTTQLGADVTKAQESLSEMRYPPWRVHFQTERLPSSGEQRIRKTTVCDPWNGFWPYLCFARFGNFGRLHTIVHLNQQLVEKLPIGVTVLVCLVGLLLEVCCQPLDPRHLTGKMLQSRKLEVGWDCDRFQNEKPLRQWVQDSTAKIKVIGAEVFSPATGIVRPLAGLVGTQDRLQGWTVGEKTESWSREAATSDRCSISSFGGRKVGQDGSEQPKLMLCPQATPLPPEAKLLPLPTSARSCSSWRVAGTLPKKRTDNG